MKVGDNMREVNVDWPQISNINLNEKYMRGGLGKTGSG
jgi:hypothetical protein